VLTCHVQPGWGFVVGSSKHVRCAYHPQVGGEDVYEGRISKFGVDIGYTSGAQIVWDVIAPTTDIGPGALQGDYAGATASATLFAGAGAHALVGGFDRSFSLQPVSVEGNSGFDVAAGVGEMSLHAVAPPTPPRRAMAQMQAPPPPSRFVVFFNFNRATLTPEARDVVAHAVDTAEHAGSVRIHIAGHTDTVGSASYNKRLSVRRAEAVKMAMVHDGLNPRSILIEGRGFRDPLVPTGPGVREPQNRRAVIDLGNPAVSEYRRSLTRHYRSI
jgi:outer membrane protein OmpA-like peptidoglycan-associated protein